MATLGKGARVWIGWASAIEVNPRAASAVCSTGTIIEGPFAPGVHICAGNETRIHKHVMWNVALDNGLTVAVAEPLLHPIDDGDPVEVEHDEEVTA